RVRRLVQQLRKTLDAALTGHHNVEEDDVRLLRPHLGDRVVDVARLADDVDVRLRAQQHAQAGADDRVVVDDDDADHRAGTSTTSVVPDPGADSICSRPSTSATRSRIPDSPIPSLLDGGMSGEKPCPSSSTTAVTMLPRR